MLLHSPTYANMLHHHHHHLLTDLHLFTVVITAAVVDVPISDVPNSWTTKAIATNDLLRPSTSKLTPLVLVLSPSGRLQGSPPSGQVIYFC